MNPSNEKILCGIIFLFFAACALSGCRGAEEPAGPPPIAIAVANSLEPAASACLDAFSGLHAQGVPLAAKTLPDTDIATALEDSGISAVIQWQEPPAEEWSALIGWTGISIAVNPDNPVKNISSAQARAIASGLITRWEDAGGSPGVIHVLAYDAESAWAVLFEGVVLAGSRLSSDARIVPSAEAMPAAVNADPQAIGFMMMFQKAAGARILTVDSITADYSGLISGAYPFRIPIFLRAREPVSAEILSFAGWAQSVSGQAVLMTLQSRE
jgi:phosphate transport system substrate-binding protein